MVATSTISGLGLVRGHVTSLPSGAGVHNGLICYVCGTAFAKAHPRRLRIDHTHAATRARDAQEFTPPDFAEHLRSCQDMWIQLEAQKPRVVSDRR